jgi:class 3 adenylate cyclase/tetratricopeptide (TPR) repeat protein
LAVDWMRDEPERRWRVVDGSLCFADISGFTALSERLARRGRVGAEELVQTLSGVFGEMVDIAAERGGQLLKFGGDALLFLFPGKDHTAAAAGAAAEMRRELRRAAQVPTAVGRLRLSMSVGVHSGDVHLFLVGAPTRELLVLGPAVGATIAAEHAAGGGQILLTNAAAARLVSTATKRHDPAHHLLRWRRAPGDPVEVPERPPAPDPLIRALLPVGLAGALADNPEPGHRIATVAFVRFSGTDRLLADGMDTAAAALDDLVGTIQAAVHDEQVTLLGIDIDTDGGKVICSTGVPTRTEDDEGRMLRALGRINSAHFPCAVQIGVNRGHVFAAELGSPRRAAYSAMGDTTNTAARIAAATPAGAIYAHPSVLENARTLRGARPVGPLTFKGKREPMTVYEVGEELGPRRRSQQDTLPVVGRDVELGRLRDALARRRDGEGGVVTVTGPPGLGKSRLVRDALASGDGSARVELRAEPYGLSTPYRPLRDPVRELLGIERAESAAMTASLLRKLEDVAPALVPFAPLLGGVAHVDVPPTPEVDAIADRYRPDRTADVLVELLRLDAPDGLVIVVEDGQWVDEPTALVLARLAALTDVLPWLLIVTRRDAPGGFVPTDGEQLVVGPLSDDSVRDLVNLATEATPLRPHELDSIVAQAAGSPLFIEELSRAVLAVSSLETVPDSINAAIAAQVDALAPPARRVLAYAAVLGRSFRRQVLFELMHADGFDLDEATRAELDLFFDRDGPARVRFHNGLVRDVVYEGMAYRTRARLHGIAAETLERISEDRDVESDMLAHHFWQAGDALRALSYSLRAADRAERMYANAEAAAQLERALDAARRLPAVTRDEQFACWQRLGELRDRAGLLGGALDAYSRAATLVPNDPVLRAGLLLRRAHAHERAGSYPLALRTASRVRNLLDGIRSAGAGAVRADALAFTALVRQRQEHVLEALRQAESAMQEGRSSGALAAQARASNVISWAATMLGRPDAADWARRSLALYEAAGELNGQADLANNLGIQAYYEGRWSDALELYRRSRDACARVGNVIDAAATDANIGEVLVNQGRFDEAEPLLRDASRVLRASGHLWGAAFAEMHLGRLLARAGDVDHAIVVLTAVRARFASLGRGASVYETSLHLADCLTLAGRPSDALAELAGSVGATSDDVSIFDAARSRVTAEALVSLGRVEEASDAFVAGIAAARAWALEYDLSLLLAASTAIPFSVSTGRDEPAADESARLLDRLGVVAQPVRAPSLAGASVAAD